MSTFAGDFLAVVCIRLICDTGHAALGTDIGPFGDEGAAARAIAPVRMGYMCHSRQIGMAGWADIQTVFDMRSAEWADQAILQITIHMLKRDCSTLPEYGTMSHKLSKNIRQNSAF